MRYHLLKQGFTTEQFSEESIFAPSYLESKAFTNVSLGQAVELVTKNGKESALSANHTESTITIRVCYQPCLPKTERVHTYIVYDRTESQQAA